MRQRFKDLVNCRFTPEGDLDLSKNWWSYTVLGRKFIRFKDLFDDEKADMLEEKYDNDGVYIEAYIIVSMDKDTNYYSEEVDEYFADELPEMNEKEMEKLETIAYDLDGYEFTELD